MKPVTWVTGGTDARDLLSAAAARARPGPRSAAVAGADAGRGRGPSGPRRRLRSRALATREHVWGEPRERGAARAQRRRLAGDLYPRRAERGAARPGGHHPDLAGRSAARDAALLDSLGRAPACDARAARSRHRAC